MSRRSCYIYTFQFKHWWDHLVRPLTQLHNDEVDFVDARSSLGVANTIRSEDPTDG
jgi:hypothetical protein